MIAKQAEDFEDLKGRISAESLINAEIQKRLKSMVKELQGELRSTK